MRATEVVIVAKVLTQGSAQLRRLGADFKKLGAEARAAQALDATNLRAQKQSLAVSQAASRIQLTQLRGTRDLKQIGKEIMQNDLQRDKIAQRMVRAKAEHVIRNLEKEGIINAKQLEILQTRQQLAVTRIAAEQELVTEQLRLQEAEMVRINQLMAQQEAMLARAKRAAPFANAGRMMSHAGRAATFGGLLATVGFGAASSKYANFDKLATRAATQSAETTKGIEVDAARLEKAIMDMMMVFPATQDQMSEAAYDIYSSLNVTFGGGMKLLDLFNRAAVAGQVDLTTATEASITVLENFDQELANTGVVSQQTYRVLDQMFGIVKYGRMSFDDMQQIMSQVAPAAHAAGSSIQDVSGAVALLTRKIGVAKTGAGLARLFEVLGDKDFRAGMRKAGVAIDDVQGNLKPFPQIMAQIERLNPSRLNDLIQVITQFGRGKGQGIKSTVQARRALTEIINSWQEYLGLQKKATTELGEFRRSYEVLSKRPGVQWDVMINQLRVIALQIGQAAIPVLINFFHWLSNVGQKFANLGGNTQQWIIKLVALAGVIALVGGPILILLGSLSSLIGLIYGLSGGTAAVAGESVGAAGGIARMAAVVGRLGVITGVTVAALAGLLSVYEEFTQKNVEGNSAQKFARAILKFDKGVQGVIPDFIKKKGIFGTALKANNDLADYLLKQEWLTGKATPKAKNKKTGWSAQVDEWAKNLEKAVHQAERDTIGGLVKKNYKDILAATAAFGSEDAKKLKKWSDDRKKVIKDAAKDAQQIMENVVDALVAKYNELEGKNRDAFGTLFQGPWLTSETVSLAKEWGIKPEMQDLTRDVHEQRMNFQKWNSTLGTIAKRGAPKELVEQLRSLGPEAMDMLGELSRATPAELKKFIREWKLGQDAIKKATESDFQRTINEYKSHGGNVVEAIIDGIDAKDQLLKDRFTRLVKESFAADIMTQAVSDALSQWMQDNPKPVAVAAAATRGSAYPDVYARSGNPMLRGQWTDPYGTERDARKGARGPGRGPSRTTSSVTYNYNLYAVPNEDQGTFIRRAAWHIKRVL